MSLTLYAHPFSAFCWKVLIALYENRTPFHYRLVADAAGFAELAALWPLRKFPVLKEGERTVIESSVIIEYLMLRHPGLVRLIPEDIDAALAVRFMDRFFDNYVIVPMQKLVADCTRAEGEHDNEGVAAARIMLDVAYGFLEKRVAHQGWAVGDNFTMGDCAAAPALFYADWVHPIGDLFSNLRAYRARLLARPSIVRTVDEARPYRNLFPPGAPERD
jgi:glutathione S-transferase